MDYYSAGSVLEGLNVFSYINQYNILRSYLNERKEIERYCNYKRNHEAIIKKEFDNKVVSDFWDSLNIFENATINKEFINSNINRKLFVDSGAFTAWTKGETIDVDKYIEWINTYDSELTLYCQIDCIPGDIVHGATPEQVKEAAYNTWKNFLYMRNKVASPDKLLYTFHVGEPLEYLKQALEYEDEFGRLKYIALGGMVGKNSKVRDNFLNKCFEVIRNSSNPEVKVHAFGMTEISLLEKYPITSADSTSYIMVGANGNLCTSFGILNVSDKSSHSKDNITNLPEVHKQVVLEEIKSRGFELEDLMTNYKYRHLHNLIFTTDKLSAVEYKNISYTKSLF